MTGWPERGFTERSPSSYCGVGVGASVGREFAESHFLACLHANIPITGSPLFLIVVMAFWGWERVGWSILCNIRLVFQSMWSYGWVPTPVIECGKYRVDHFPFTSPTSLLSLRFRSPLFAATRKAGVLHHPDHRCFIHLNPCPDKLTPSDSSFIER
jgi:hypothetical protein